MCEALDITAYQASLGSDLSRAPSGAFLNHPDVGFAEEIRLPPRLVDPVDIIRIQRYFGVSWPTALVRLRQMNAITQTT